MKNLVFFLGILANLAAKAAPGDSVITEWDFNTPESVAASAGSGEFRPLGGVISTNFQGAPSDPGDPNGAISLRAFPPQGTLAKSAGLEFSTSARGWRDLGLRFEVRASATANRWLRVLVIPPGGVAIDAGVYEIVRDSVFSEALIDLSSYAELNNAESLTIQIVSDVGSDGQYLGVKPKTDGTNSYSSSGTWRLDRVALLGNKIEGTIPELRLDILQQGDQLSLSWSERDGSSYTVWRAPALLGPWEDLGAGSAGIYSEVNADKPQYYRVTSP